MKPNHICKYSKCTLGKDGGRKHYYACNYCDAVESWRSMACCKEHYLLYQEEVLSARAKGKTPDPLPDRTDISKDQVKKLKKKPLAKVKEETEKELSEYKDMVEEVGILETVNHINEELDKDGCVSE